MAYLTILDDYPSIFYAVASCFKTQKPFWTFAFFSLRQSGFGGPD